MSSALLAAYRRRHATGRPAREGSRYLSACIRRGRPFEFRPMLSTRFQKQPPRIHARPSVVPQLSPRNTSPIPFELLPNTSVYCSRCVYLPFFGLPRTISCLPRGRLSPLCTRSSRLLNPPCSDKAAASSAADISCTLIPHPPCRQPSAGASCTELQCPRPALVCTHPIASPHAKTASPASLAKMQPAIAQVRPIGRRVPQPPPSANRLPRSISANSDIFLTGTDGCPRQRGARWRHCCLARALLGQSGTRHRRPV